MDKTYIDIVDVVGQRRKKEEKHQFFASTNTFGDTSIVFALTNLQWLADPDIWQTVDHNQWVKKFSKANNGLTLAITMLCKQKCQGIKSH